MKTIKYISLLLTPVFCVLSTFAQQQPYEMMVEGVKVIVQPTTNEIVEVQTIIKGGVQNYPASKMGIEALAMTALSECGTLKNDKNSWKNKLEKVSAQVSGNTSKDYAVFRMNCIKGDFNTVWPLYTEALTQPKFDEKEFARIKQDAINFIKSMESQPDAAIDKYADKVAFAGLDYAKDPDGSVAIIEKLTPAETKTYYNSILTKSRLLVVVVGNMEKPALQGYIKTLLASVKPGQAFTLKKTAYAPAKNTFSAAPKELATNYILGITSGPKAGSEDYNAFNVAMRIFSDKHFLEVRTNNGLSYAPGAWFSNGTTSVAKFSVSTTQPDKYIAVFDQLVNKVKTKGFAEDEVKNMKVEYLTGFYYKQETNSAQASSIASNEVLHNNWKRSLTLADDVKSLTVDEVNKAFNKYVVNTTWVYQGDPKKVTPANFINGTLRKGEGDRVISIK